MPRPATGQVVERETQRGRVFALRFRVYGERQYVTLGAVEDGWTHQRAEDELQNVLADVRRGIWHPPTQSSRVLWCSAVLAGDVGQIAQAAKGSTSSFSI